MPRGQSLHQQHGPTALGILQGGIKGQFKLPNLGTGFSIEDRGNHYIIRKGDKERHVPLFAAREVFAALELFLGRSTDDQVVKDLVEYVKNDLRLCLKLKKGETIDDFDDIIDKRIPRLRRVLREARR